MRFLNGDVMRAVDVRAFRERQPFPWLNPEGFLTESGFESLRRTLPDPGLFDSVFGKRRKYGQQSHDRLSLEYHESLDVAPEWHEFVAELRGPEYRDFLSDTMGASRFDLLLHWHYTPNGCSVSPHCDSLSKLGSHIFYFSSAEDWRPEWGGETLILDDAGRYSAHSAPRFEDFASVTPAEAIGNRSLLFARKNHSWHGVREIRCPPDRLRKVFIVVIERAGLGGRVLGQIAGLRALLDGRPAAMR